MNKSHSPDIITSAQFIITVIMGNVLSGKYCQRYAQKVIPDHKKDTAKTSLNFEKKNPEY